MNPVRISAKIGSAEFSTACMGCDVQTVWRPGSVGEALFQLAMQHLAGGVARHLVFGDELVGAWTLETGHTFFRPRGQLALLARRAVMQHDHGMNALAPFVVG